MVSFCILLTIECYKYSEKDVNKQIRFFIFIAIAQKIILHCKMLSPYLSHNDEDIIGQYTPNCLVISIELQYKVGFFVEQSI